jgi:hypothetical protein
MAERCRHQGKALTIGLLEIQREYEPDRQAMLAALRVVLGLPRVPSPLGIPAASDPEP